MRKILLAVGLVLAIMYVVPFPVYGLLSALTGLQPPTEGSATLFLLSVLVIKVGVAVAFVLLYSLARDSWAGRWMLYALIWWLMFAVVEVGQAVTPDYSWLDALGGIVAEAIYFPVAALVVVRLLRPHKAVENRV
jgi:hypothetical protein